MASQRLLDGIKDPGDLTGLNTEQLNALAGELRGRILDVVRRRGGHLASNLGLAELTIALHSVFNFKRDRLLWDVGHQCYAHKLLTGRNDAFDTLRQAGGLSGFPNPDESEFDLFKVGHAGTAISTAMGLALGDQGEDASRKVVAVVGDASIVNGLSLEAINNAALLNRQLLVILNDNSMAIDVTQGGLARALDRLRLTRTYDDLRCHAEEMLRHLPLGQNLSDALRHIRGGLRSAVHGQQAFEALGFRYFGPVDGHDIPELLAVLRKVSTLNSPVLLHVHTEKGRGYDYAVEDPTAFHSPSSWTEREGQIVFAGASRRMWTCAFADAIVAAADRDHRVCAITAAMPDGTGLVGFRRRFPDRYFDVGINESHAVAMAAGMAKAGLRPVVAIYSTFMQRAFDQVFQEVSLQKLPVVLTMDRAGLVGSDGAVHHGFCDIALMRTLPHLAVMAPADAAEMDASLELALSLDGPAAIRYPRDQLPPTLPGECPPFELGQSRTLRDGEDGAFLCFGTTVGPALAAAETLSEKGFSVAVVNARFAKPLDAKMIQRELCAGKAVITVEDHSVVGGFGSAVIELAVASGWPTEGLRCVGMPDEFIPHGSRGEQLSWVGLDADSLAATMRQHLEMTAQRAGIAGREQ